MSDQSISDHASENIIHESEINQPFQDANIDFEVKFNNLNLIF